LPRTSGLAGTFQIGVLDADLAAVVSNRSLGLGEIVTAALAVNLYLGSPPPRAARDAADSPDAPVPPNSADTCD
ncbi:MAG TPA: hypothetical protein VJ385_20280, partial [Fibrobacteria bacterium]|nr:hypothetical protein [Fibrobacteria bacterium]